MRKKDRKEDARTRLGKVHERSSARGPTRSDATHTDITYHEMYVRFLLHYFESADASGGEPGDSAGDVRGDLLAKLRMLQ